MTTFLWTAQSVNTCVSAISTNMNCILMPSILISTKNFDLIERKIFLVPITEINILGVRGYTFNEISSNFFGISWPLHFLVTNRDFGPFFGFWVMANFKKVDGESVNYHVKTIFKIWFGGQDRWNVHSFGSGGTTAVAMLMQAQYPNGYLLITAH